MPLKGSQDVATGVLFALIGTAALWFGADLSIGTPQRPGTGVLPRILGWCLIGTGAVVGIKGVLAGGPQVEAWAWRPLVMISLAIAAFALLIDRAGLVIAMLALMVLAALGTPETRWREFALFAALLILIGVAMFIWGLGMPIRVLPGKLPWT
jgi:Tripartite tricarboxylate transporter TctB family